MTTRLSDCPRFLEAMAGDVKSSGQSLEHVKAVSGAGDTTFGAAWCAAAWTMRARIPSRHPPANQPDAHRRLREKRKTQESDTKGEHDEQRDHLQRLSLSGPWVTPLHRPWPVDRFDQ
jgi:hypothetical protein